MSSDPRMNLFLANDLIERLIERDQISVFKVWEKENNEMLTNFSKMKVKKADVKILRQID